MEFGGQMRSLLLWVVILLVLVNGWWVSCCYGHGYCWEQERTALLQLKASFNYPNSHFLHSWGVEGTECSDYCDQWEGIECNSTTGRVIQISLNDTRIYWNQLGDWYLNASIFLPFQQLKFLYLSGNKLAGWFENEGSERLSSSLKNLEVLDLSSNYLNNSILSSLNGFSSLKYLSLSSNKLKGFIHIKGSERLSSSLRNLEVLDLSWNVLNNSSILSSLNGFSSLKSLNLAGNNLKGFIHIKELNGFISLKELDLSYNEIESFDCIQGSERLSSSLRNLEVLDLSNNYYLNNSILSSLNGFSSLKSLSLRDCNLKGSIRIKDKLDFNALTNLEELDLSDNEVESFVTPKGVKSFSKLKVLHLDNNRKAILLQSLGAFSSLKTLYLRNNSFNGTINSQDLPDLMSNLEELLLDRSSLNNNFLQSIGVMTSLKVMSLSGCGLNGTLPTTGWCELKSLEELDLSANWFHGSLPSCLGNLTALRVLDLSDNQFTGNIASSPLANLTSLEYISLSNNNFHVPISFSSFYNLSNLEVILSDSNKLLVDSEFQTRVPTFQLKVFSLSNCINIERDAAPPNFIFYQNELRVVDLSHSNLNGKFPGWLLKNNTKLEKLYLRNNSFVGPLQLPSHPNPNISYIDISNNNFGGQLPTNISLVFPNSGYMNMSRNAFEGIIPSSFGDMKSLRLLDLSNNNLSGGVLELLARDCPSLSFLKLSNNKLHGQIFPKHVELTSLRNLYLNGNNFVGEIPDGLSNSGYLEVMDMSNNHLSGNLPRWLGNISSMMEIDLSRNHLEGPIPLEFCSLDWQIEFLDLSENNLSGSIPTCFNPSRITHVHLNKNKLSGPMTRAFYNSSSLVTLDLSENNFNGNIPNWIGTLSTLSILLLKANHFEGKIPIQICHLTQLSMLDLSQNNLSGTIPPCLSDIAFEGTYQKSFHSSGWLVFGSYDTESLANKWKTVSEDIYSGFYEADYLYPMADAEEKVELRTKKNSYSYKGHILDSMSGIDLSCNQLTGEIPPEIGNLSNIRMLNISHNNLFGSIPATFSNLRQTESMDLSYNHLSGRIPSQLTELNSLEVFSVAHNNLQGPTPDRKAQFGTFDESSYEGNPLLCGPPLHNNCTTTESPSPIPNASDGEREDSGFIDMSAFYASFVASFIVVVLGIVAVLYINPHWRRVWFYLIEVGITSCHYFVLDCFHKLFISRRHV